VAHSREHDAARVNIHDDSTRSGTPDDHFTVRPNVRAGRETCPGRYSSGYPHCMGVDVHEFRNWRRGRVAGRLLGGYEEPSRTTVPHWLLGQRSRTG
jgi:hypothetical protein